MQNAGVVFSFIDAVEQGKRGGDTFHLYQNIYGVNAVAVAVAIAVADLRLEDTRDSAGFYRRTGKGGRDRC